MRVFWSTLAVLLMLFGATVPTGLVRAQSTPADYLPSTLYLSHADCFRIDGDGVLDFAGLLTRFPNVPDAAIELSTLGWQSGAYRQFGCDTPPAGTAGWIDISVHRFATEEGAAAAAPFFADARALGTSLQMVPGAMALTGPVSNGTEYTRYVTYGAILFRVTGVAPVGSPQHDVEQVANMQIGIAAIFAGREARATQPTTAEPGTSTYTLIDLGTGTGNWGSAQHINNRNQILMRWGTAGDPAELAPITTDNRLVLISPGQTIDLTALGIDFGIGLTEAGLVLGSSGPEEYLYDSGTEQVHLLLGGASSWLTDVNDDGTVVGQNDGQAVVMRDGQIRALPVPPGFDGMRANAINHHGSVAGTAYVEHMLGDQRAMLIHNGVQIVLDPAPGATGSNAVDVSDSGLVIGTPELKGARAMVMAGRGFLYDASRNVMVDLGTLPGYRNSTPVAINELGQVVGAAWDPIESAEPFRRAFLFDYRTSLMTDLNSLIDPRSGFVLTDALDINDAGQIVGRGLIDGEMHAFVLMPNP